MSIENQKPTFLRRTAEWLGINRAMMAVLVVTAGMGFSEEIWRNFLSLYLKDTTGGVLTAAKYMGIFAVLVNLLEGFGYIIGGQIAHRLGARTAMLVSALPMILGFSILLAAHQPWLIILGALFITNWEPLSVPATFEVVGGEVAENRRTIAFAVQSIQKRLPKVLGPLVGGLVMMIGYWLNLILAFGLIFITNLVQFRLLNELRPTKDPVKIPFRQILRDIPKDLRTLLTAEIILRWGDWFVRDFAVLYVVGVLLRSKVEAGMLLAVTSLTALLTYIPMGKIIDNAKSPRPFIGITFIFFALFPLNLVLLPRYLPQLGIPVMAALVIVFHPQRASGAGRTGAQSAHLRRVSEGDTRALHRALLGPALICFLSGAADLLVSLEQDRPGMDFSDRRRHWHCGNHLVLDPGQNQRKGHILSNSPCLLHGRFA